VAASASDATIARAKERCVEYMRVGLFGPCRGAMPRDMGEDHTASVQTMSTEKKCSETRASARSDKSLNAGGSGSPRYCPGRLSRRSICSPLRDAARVPRFPRPCRVVSQEPGCEVSCL
jgi:hypothetical protein